MGFLLLAITSGLAALATESKFTAGNLLVASVGCKAKGKAHGRDLLVKCCINSYSGQVGPCTSHYLHRGYTSTGMLWYHVFFPPVAAFNKDGVGLIVMLLVQL